MRNSALWLVSLASKARKISVGALACQRALQKGSADIIIAANDAADNTKKKFKNSCMYYGAEFYQYSTKEELSHYTGKENVSVLAVCDKNFAAGIKKAVLKNESVNNHK